jgi:cyclopropane fatty-acyl-phospholipid synthase-like methyltransferase
VNDISDATSFDNLALIYERLAEPITSGIGLQVLDLLNLRSGQRMIDVAAGPGASAVTAAERGIHVLATDVAPAMVARAAERLRPYPNSDVRTMSCDALDAPDASFDVAISLFGVLAFSTWQTSLAELVRVTRPGGHVAATMWTEERDATPAYVVKRVFESLFPGRELWPANFFPHWTVGMLGKALRDAGCDDVDVRICRAEWRPVSSSGVPIGSDEVLLDGEPIFATFQATVI